MCLLLNIFGTQIHQRLALYYASVVDKHGGVTQLQNVSIPRQVPPSANEADLFDNLLRDVFNLIPLRNVTFVVGDVILPDVRSFSIGKEGNG